MNESSFYVENIWCVAYLLHLECGFDDVIRFLMASKMLQILASLRVIHSYACTCFGLS
jgi:hypothetical protein